MNEDEEISSKEVFENLDENELEPETLEIEEEEKTEEVEESEENKDE